MVVRSFQEMAVPMNTASTITGTVCVYYPAICCSTGLCGPSVDSHLLQVARDLRRFEAEGVRVTPGRFAQGRDRTIWLGEHSESREKWDESFPAGGAYPPGIALHPAGEAAIGVPHSAGIVVS
jgi:hypothetical protein